jgi:hypothetical protein
MAFFISNPTSLQTIPKISGIATMVAGSVDVAITTQIQLLINSQFQLSRCSNSVNVGNLYYTILGNTLQIRSSNPLENVNVAWVLIKV